jgi:hypothetical protein
MTQLRAVGIAAFFLGIGMAGEPFAPVRALIAAVILAVFVLALERGSTPVVVFAVGFLGVLLACFIQHNEIYPGTGVVAFGLGVLSVASLGRTYAPLVVSSLGAVVGTSLFLLL